VDWDERDAEFEGDATGGGPPFPEDAVERELALVALEAAALARRIFPPPLTRRDLSAEARQATLALALVDPDQGLTARTLAPVLALDMDEAREVLAELVALGMAASAEPWPSDDDEDVYSGDAPYALTEKGRSAASEAAAAAKKFLPGWPPRRP
jgi:hypothetical protein